MPHRIPLVTQTLGFIFEAIALGFLTVWQGLSAIASLISNEDWDRITGPHGVAFVACAACLVLWLNAVNRDRKEDKRRIAEDAAKERRHEDSIRALNLYSEKVMGIAVDTAKTNMHVAEAIKSLDSTIKKLVLKEGQ